MVSLLFCFAAVVLFIVGNLIVRRATPYRRIGGDAYAKKRARKTIGHVLLTAAGILVVLGLINQFYSFVPAPPDLSELGSLTNAPAHAISAVPPSRDFVNALSIPAALPLSTTNQAPADPYAGTPTPGTSSATDQVPGANPADSGGSRRETSTFSPVSTTTRAEVEKIAPFPTNATAFAASGLQNPMDVQLQDATTAIQQDTSHPAPYIRRANIYAKQRKWDMAQADYNRALQIDSKSVAARFNLAELKFMQQKFDDARTGFLPLVKDSDFGDLSQYKVFLCDLMAGHEDVASKELDVFNQDGSQASYYFANVAWSAYHKKDDDARDWMRSAVNIFAPQKTRLYATALVDLGFISDGPQKN